MMGILKRAWKGAEGKEPCENTLFELIVQDHDNVAFPAQPLWKCWTASNNFEHAGLKIAQAARFASSGWSHKHHAVTHLEPKTQ